MLRRLEIAGNPYIGVFCAANDELLIAAPDVPKSAIRHIGGALETSPIVTSVGHSTVVGSLLALNSKGILASPFIEEAELDAIGDAVYPLPHRLSAVGNNVLCNDYGAAQVGACMVANSHGAVVGSRTTPIELGRIEEGLGLF